MVSYKDTAHDCQYILQSVSLSVYDICCNCNISSLHDLDDNITSNVLKFVDDTKVCRKVNNDSDKHLQNDLDILVKQSEKWQMSFNFGKCKCLYTGQGNLNVNNKMGDTVLGTTVKERT